MEKEEFKEIVCIRKFYKAANKQDGSYQPDSCQQETPKDRINIFS